MIAETVKEKKWYTIKVQSNREKSVSERIKIDMKKYYDSDLNFLIPTKVVASVKNGKKIIKEQILYPGYIFVETELIEKVEYLVKGTTGAASVLKNSKGQSQPLKQSEIQKMIVEKEKTKEVAESSFIVGEKVEIISGSFTQFRGIIQSLDAEKNKVKIEVLIFGRPTSVDLTLTEIIKVAE
jgi:transcriptional antiterminator NusG